MIDYWQAKSTVSTPEGALSLYLVSSYPLTDAIDVGHINYLYILFISYLSVFPCYNVTVDSCQPLHHFFEQVATLKSFLPIKVIKVQESQ